MSRLNGKHVFITAAANGIGRAAALAMRAEGATVSASDINLDALQDLRREGIHVLQLDVCNTAAVQAAAKQVTAQSGAVDVLFNCAGYVHEGSLLECPEDAWDRSFDINVKGMYRLCQAFVPGMLQAGRGNIINMASVASSLKGFPRRLAYGATKAAVIGLTKALAADYVGQGIRCNAVCPGTVNTPSLRERINKNADPVAAERAFIARQPLGRLAEVSDIVPLLLYLASDESAYMTGQAISVDGGITI